MYFLHTSCLPPVLHRDLKSPNVLMHLDVDGRMRVKISDFGVAVRGGGEENEKGKGTLIWMAPELVFLHVLFGADMYFNFCLCCCQRLYHYQQTYTPLCDIFSYAIVLTEIHSWAGPYTTRLSDLRQDLLHSSLTNPSSPLPPLTFPTDVPNSTIALIRQCLEKDPTKRPQGFKEILERLKDEDEVVNVDSDMSFDVTVTGMTYRAGSGVVAVEV
ncbi:hypothetical protein HDU67_005769, partial [Dinochytrium kinnereticum]